MSGYECEEGAAVTRACRPPTRGVASTMDVCGGVTALSMHARLKLGTQPDHMRVDRAIARFNLARRGDYAAFLKLHADALDSLRPHWRDLDEADFAALLHALDDDLAALGAAPRKSAAPAIGPIDSLGVSYVVRGSRLGSQVLQKRVPPDFPNAFLSNSPSLSWPLFLRQLDARGGDPGLESATIAGARATFDVYFGLMRNDGDAS